jgi:hypothetical protein
LRQLPYLAGALAVVVTGTLVFVASANANKPPPGSHPVRFVVTDPTSAGIVEPVNLIDPSGNVLPSASCGLALQEGAGTNLAANIHGWETDPDPNDPRGLRVVLLEATLHGTVTDTAGNVYRVDGRFLQSGRQTWPSSQVPFDGIGHVTFVRPGGLVEGTAEFRDVAAFPAEWDFFFRNQLCWPV